MQPVKLTVITSSYPEILTKKFRLSADGTLNVHSAGQLAEGTYEVRDIDCIAQLNSIIKYLNRNQALIYGIPRGYAAKGIITTQRALRLNPNVDAISRDRKHFEWPDGPGVLFLDFDDLPDEKWTAERIWYQITTTCPGLAKAPALIKTSASAGIYNGDICLKGLQSWRVLMLVADATDIHRAGTTIFDRSWLAGYGNIKVSKDGKLLVRGLVDKSVFQPERLDFEAAAIVIKPLTQCKPEHTLFNSELPPIDTAEAVPGLTQTEQSNLARLIENNKARYKGVSEKSRENFIEAKVALESEPEKKKLIRNIYERAGQGVLQAEFPITLKSGESVTVGELLRHIEKYDRQYCLDPLEPDYEGSNAIILLRNRGNPIIRSFLHGGQCYQLSNVNLQAPKDYVKEEVAYKKNLPWRQAVNNCQETLRGAPEDASVWFNLGMLYCNASQWRQAIEAFQEALQINPEDATVWYRLGMSYHNATQGQRAIEAYEEVLRIAPLDVIAVKAWNNLGKVYADSNHTNKALRAYQQALQLEPEYAPAWSNLGDAYCTFNQWEKAIEAYQEALRIESMDATAWCNLGSAYKKSMQWQEAIDAYQQALQIDPENATTWRNLGVTYVCSRNQPEKVMEVYQRLKKLDFSMADAFFSRFVMP